MYHRVLAVAVMFLVSVVLTNGGTGVSSAAVKQETSKTEAVGSQGAEAGLRCPRSPRSLSF